MQYRPDPFFEAESVGPAITFGNDADVSLVADEISIDLSSAYGPNWEKKGVPLHPDRKGYLSQWPDAATDEEAEVLHLPKNLWSNPVRIKMGLPPLKKLTGRQQGGVLRKPMPPMLLWGGVGVLALLGLWWMKNLSQYERSRR